MNKDSAGKTVSKGIAGSVSLVMIIMILSRLLALVSTQVYMSYFGLDSFLNIYSFAISVPNIVFNCFGTALATVVIPIYAGHLAKGEKEKAAKFANNIITVSVSITALLVGIGLAISPFLPKLTAFKTGEEYSFAVKSLMIMMPVMFFYGLNYIFQGILQSHGKYGFPAFVSVPSSLVVIAYVFLLGDRYGIPGLLVATFIGLSLQALILIPPAMASGFRYKFTFSLKDEDMITAGKMALPVLVGVSAYQLNMFYNTTMIANFEGMVTLLTYVQNIVVYMVLAFVYSVTAVVYPKLSESASKNDDEGYKNTLSSVLKSVMMLLIPITFGFITMRRPLLELIANWGKITQSDVDKAAMLMLMYSIGIVGIGSKEILDRAFYAIKNTKIPAINGFIIMGVNIALSLVLINFIGAYGIPLAYSVSSLTGLCVLLLLLKKKKGEYGKGLGTDFVKCLISGIIMALALFGINYALDGAFSSGGILTRIIKLLLPTAAGVIIYAFCVLALKVGAAKEFWNTLKGKFTKNKA
ncbi:MAG: murein biosynthesis integral membrane protein MurJ [Clostridia bacterium]|nr:murein biosynthesis integral membrane protein MurJ [Clostridia bacterium]